MIVDPDKGDFPTVPPVATADVSSFPSNEGRQPVASAVRSAHRQVKDGASAFDVRAELLEITLSILASKSTRDAAIEVVTRLPAYFGGGRLAIGLLKSKDGECRLTAVTGVATLDHHSKLSSLFEAALDEAVQLHRHHLDTPEADRFPRKSLDNLGVVTGLAYGVSQALLAHDGECVGAILWLRPRNLCSPAAAQQRMDTVLGPIGTAIAAVSRRDRSLRELMRETLTQRLPLMRTQKFLAALAVVLLVLAIPMPYRITCDARMEPVVRRFVTAPFDATLQQALVELGEKVEEGQLLARLDGREIRWELAQLEAEIRKAEKKRDAAMASRRAAAVNVARLEVEALEHKRRMLVNRAENLEVRSPITGVVTQGDLQRAEGAKLAIGQTLFEIAPQETMILEAALPETDFACFGLETPLKIQFDAYPGQVWESQVQRVWPRTEMRDGKNVLILEAELENPHGLLRPGMAGQTKLSGPLRPLGWNLFRRPINAVWRWLNW